MSITVSASIAKKIGFASQQNSVPVLRELSIFNDTDNTYQNLTLTLQTKPDVLKEKKWTIDRIAPQSSINVDDRDIGLNTVWLADLLEKVQCEIILTLSDDKDVLYTQSYSLEALAKNEWGGHTMQELLPAFVMPNDPAIDKLLKATSDVLRRAGKQDALNGYSSNSQTRTWEIASALWTAVCDLKLSYALPPSSFERNGQKVRTPSVILENKIATCLDTSLLFASALEQLGFNPLIILTKGHAFVGLWLQNQEFSLLVTEDVSTVRKRVDLEEMITFETTLATSAQRVAFSQAIDNSLVKLNEEEFEAAVDIRRARMQKIHPLTLGLTRKIDVNLNEDTENIGGRLEDAPRTLGVDVVKVNTDNQTVSRILQWQRKLLDLTTRNRLLHLPDSAKGVRLICPDPGALEDKLADKKKIRILSLPDLESGGRDAKLYLQQTHNKLEDEYAIQALARDEVVCNKEQNKLDAALVDLYRKSKSDLEEGGANTLFLAVGFLKWKKSSTDSKSYMAPLILLPIQLDRKSALSGLTMHLLDEEPRFNLTLLELLRNDFALKIEGLDGELPTDQHGIDVDGIWNIVRRAVRDIPGFEVVKDVVIGTFSFAKYLMWKDLIDRSEQLMQSPLVKYLIERGEKDKDAVFEETGEFISVERLDETIKTEDLFLPLPADSSQIAAVVASAKGRSFVLDGPPGTGKSQTIANMIAHNLALGRRVLFVAEKKAALEVVYRRLEAKGLGEFCLELHSSKTSPTDFLKQLDRAWDVRDKLSQEEWLEESHRVQKLRDKLNKFVELLHKRWPNGITVYQAIGKVIKYANVNTPRFNWPAGTIHDHEQMEQFRDIVRRLELNKSALDEAKGLINFIKQSEWTNGWQESVFNHAHELINALKPIQQSVQKLSDAIRFVHVDKEDISGVQQLIEIGELLIETSGIDLSFAFKSDAKEVIETSYRALELLKQLDEDKKRLSITYDHNSWQKIDTNKIAVELSLADKKFWFLSTKAHNKLIDEIKSQLGVSVAPNLSIDLPIIKKLQENHAKLVSLGITLSSSTGWQELNTDIEKLNRVLSLANNLRAAIAKLASSPEQMIELRTQVKSLVVDANEFLSVDGTISLLTQQLQKELTTLVKTKESFYKNVNNMSDVSSLTKMNDDANEIITHLSSLKSLCDWNRVKEEAITLDLLSLVEALERDVTTISALETFDAAYCRWFANWTIDAEPLLHNFVPAEHKDDIETYRVETDKLANLTVSYIRARLCGELPAKNNVSQEKGFTLLKHELQKSRRHKPVRVMAAEMGSAITKLAPCMLMSPLSVAQFLPSNQEAFDLVIFDEASQVTPWDAVGAMARGKQVIVAGDPRQMPPTSFFNRGANESEDDVEEDMESILEECLAAGLYNHNLSWHYRSRHESLITFSNHRYYDGSLITFPAARTQKSAVYWRKVDGVYAKGVGRSNQLEAEAIVDETVKRLRDPDFIASNKSIGIITLNTEQQKLISDLLDRARQKYPEIEPFFQLDKEEPVVVKNLETVQGDERDIILLGIGYGPTEPHANTMSMNFGPLNRDGGHRRLNVAVTRAREEMIVFTSFDSSMIDLNRTSARAVSDLKNFIEFAKNGPMALARSIKGSVGGYDSPFEEAVANGLRMKGWQVIPQIGVSRFRIDLGIVHPDKPGDYLVGVECDGATYHSAATARDRDKVRAAILEGLGWKLLRLWSTEWWIDKEKALDRLDLEIRKLLEQSRENVFSPTSSTESNKLESGTSVTAEDMIEKNDNVVDFPVVENREIPAEDEQGLEEESVKYAELPIMPDRKLSISKTYHIVDLTSWQDRVHPDLFHEQEYEEILVEIISDILKCEAPILDVSLVQKVARAHGFNRAGRLIRERILEVVDEHFYNEDDPIGGNFIWLSKAQADDWTLYRLPQTDDDVRQVDEISSKELKALAVTIEGDEKWYEMAKILGIKRVTSQAKNRLESVLSEPVI